MTTDARDKETNVTYSSKNAQEQSFRVVSYRRRPKKKEPKKKKKSMVLSKCKDEGRERKSMDG
jgi:hypothetical protein